jgi:acyl-CoA thioesterase-1
VKIAARLRTLCSILVLLLFGACRPDAPNLWNGGRTIVCLGDSITAGVGADPGRAYPDVLAQKLGAEVVNEGVSGDTAEEGLARIDRALADEPWLVVVELGGNDILRQVPPEQTEAALRGVLDRVLAAHVVPLLVRIDVPFAGRYSEVFDRLEKDYKKVPVVEDALGDILTDPTLKSDTIHPNNAGHAKLAEAIADEIEPLLKARRKR